MSIQEIREALSGFREKFGLSTFADHNVADLADLLVRLNDIEKAIIHRIEVLLDERGERTTEVFVEPGVTVKEVGLGASIRPEGGANSTTAAIIEGPKGKMYLTKAGFAELARRGLIRCRDCEHWEKSTMFSHLPSGSCDHPKLRMVDESDMDDDGLGVVDEDESSMAVFGPDFGCIHFKPRQQE